VRLPHSLQPTCRFTPLPSLPNVEWSDPNLRFTDLDGDSRADILITEHEALTWHPSLAEAGFGPAIRVPKPKNEDDGPAVIFADADQAIFLADMSGDRLSDIVRIRNGEVARSSTTRKVGFPARMSAALCCSRRRMAAGRRRAVGSSR
jgi:hypothetical protein